MAKATSTEGKSKTDIVRDYVRSHPEVPARQIVTDLRAYGISLALAQKTKYPEGRKRSGGGRKPGHVKSAAAGHVGRFLRLAVRQICERLEANTGY